MQNYTSKRTSINSKKSPAVYSMARAIEAMTNKMVLDVGGGRFDTAQETARTYGATVSIYDPYNRSEEHNREVIAGAYDVAIISNVLNVIDSTAARGNVVQLAGSKADTILITVYEGDRSGTGRQLARKQIHSGLYRGDSRRPSGLECCSIWQTNTDKTINNTNKIKNIENSIDK